MTTTTANYGWVMPDVGGSASAWGDILNSTIKSIDGQVHSNVAPVTALQAQLSPSYLTLWKTGSSDAVITFGNLNNTQARWQFYETNEAETGGNAGSNLGIQAIGDNGAYLGWALSINRASQRISIAQAPVGGNDIAHKGYVDGQDSSYYNAAINHANAVQAPVGSIVMWGGSNPPAGWTWCLGGHLKYTDYPALFNVLGGTFFWDGTYFGLPNIAGRMVLGYDGGGWSLNRQDGEYQHTLSINELASHAHSTGGHTHSINDPEHSHYDSMATIPSGAWTVPGGGAQPVGGGQTGPASTGISINTGYETIYSNGSGWGHNNMQPSIVLGFIIRCY